MNNTVDISFLKSVQEIIAQGLHYFKVLDIKEQPAKAIQWRLKAMKETCDNILHKASIDASGNIFTDKSNIPEILWIRMSSAMIENDILRYSEQGLESLAKDMNRCYKQMKPFYELHVCE